MAAKHSNSFIDITGARFGMLVAIRSVVHNNRERAWICVCDCGNEHTASSHNLRSGSVTSCGCDTRRRMAESRTTHGMTGTKEYHAWVDMRRRCNNPNHPAYPNYGERGIRVCTRWEQSFEAFYSDMGPARKGESLDRLDNNDSYHPSNCRWASTTEQLNNQRRNVRITVNGETHTVAEWSRITGIGAATIRHRLKVGWSPDDSVAEPLFARSSLPRK